MSVGYEMIILYMAVHGAMAFGVGVIWSLIPKRVIGLLGFLLFYIAIAVWYTATFNFQMLIYSTFFVSYVAVGLIGFALCTYWLGTKGYYKKRMQGRKEDVES